MIVVKHLSKHFGDIKAVDDISFTVNNGERFVLLGTSGCGKTTTLKMINRLIEPDAGEVLINGEPNNLKPPEQLRRNIGYILQNTGLFPHYTIERNISIVPELLGWDKHKTRQRAGELMEKFNMPPETYLHLYPDQLSGGQQQRVGFARALMANPPVLLMDEPLGALDPVTRQQMRKEFTQLNELQDKTIVLVTHDVPEAIELGDRICVMDKGKIQQIGTALDILLHPANGFVKHFFSHEHFMSQLRALRLKNLIDYLPASLSGQEVEILDMDTTIMEAIEKLSDLESENKTLSVMDTSNSKSYLIDINSLLKAVQVKLNREQ